MTPERRSVEVVGPIARHPSSTDSPVGDSQTTFNTADARLLDAVLSPGRQADSLEQVIGVASWVAFGKVLVVIAAALTGVRLASPAAPLNPFLYSAMFVAFGGVGGWLFVGGSRDRGARSLGGFFLLLGLACARGASRTVAHRVGGLTGAALLTDLDPLIPLYLWVFAREFPSRIVSNRERRVVNALSSLALAAAVPLVAMSFAAATGVHVYATWLVGRPDLYWVITFGFTALAFPYLLWRCVRRATDDRLRASWMLLALLLGLAPLVLEVMAEVFIPSFESWILASDYRPVIGTLVFAFLLTLPFTTAYAVVSHQTLDVRIVLRRALQCSLTKYACAVVCVLPLVCVGWLAYAHRTMAIQDLAALASARLGMAGAALGVIGLFFYPRMLSGVDRLFFGPRYDLRAVNADFRAAIWRTANADASVALLTQTATSVLSAATASVLLRVNADGTYHDRVAGSILPVDSELIDLLARDRRIDVSVTDQLLASIGDQGARWIARTTSVLLVPLRASTNGLLGVLAVGPRRDDRPYYPEDRHLLVDLAVHASPILERQLSQASRRADRPRGAIVGAECPVCGRVFPHDTAACYECHVPMERCSLPEIVSEKYRVTSRIGRGGMGVVYRAEDEALGRTVALKTLPYVSGLAELRSSTEGRLMAAAIHPNLATVFGLELAIDRPVLVLEFLAGGTLKERLVTGPLAITDAVEVVMGICDGVSWLHRQGVSHGDIKPSNIGFAENGTPKLLDFGLAEATRVDSTAAHRPAGRGTLQYCCPYQSGSSFASNDLWALSAVLFESVSGRRLFDVLPMASVGHQEFDVRRFRPAVAPELALVISRALSLDYTVRPQSVDEFRLWLERARPI
jgi:hypothetical protein